MEETACGKLHSLKKQLPLCSLQTQNHIFRDEKDDSIRSFHNSNDEELKKKI